MKQFEMKGNEINWDEAKLNQAKQLIEIETNKIKRNEMKLS